jgi:uncharacterized membrane protein YkvA (DUF1232 family)
MRWRWWLAGHPAVVRAGGVWAILKQARLAFRLLRDERVPTATKLLIPAMLLYLISPLDLMPDLIPMVGQVDDVMILLLGIVAFIKLCPEWLVAEHQGSNAGVEAPPRGPAVGSEPIDASYQWVDGRRAR